MSKTQTPKVGDLIDVYWLDNATRDRWMPNDEDTSSISPSTCRTVGWVRRYTSEHLEMHGSMTDYGNISQQMAILRCCITRLAILQRATAAAPKWTKK